MQNILLKIKNFFKNLYANEYFKAFLWIYLVGLFCFATRAAFNYFTLPMGGDYTLQTYAFYAQGYNIFWEFVRTGEMPLYDFSNFLGANYLGTQSFYYVFSPLFYLLCLCPKPLLYQGIFFHMVFKFALGGFFMYVLLRKYFKVSSKMSWLGGFIYAFSGWTLFYVWFHFGDVMAFFPLFIMGFEKCLKERKGWLLSVSIFLCGLANYFFLVNFCIFGLFYALYRWIHIYGINKKRGFSASERWGVLLQGILHCAIGVMMTAICVLPSLQVALNSTRSTSSSSYLISLLQTIFVNPSKDLNGYTFGEIKTLKEIFEVENLKQLGKVLFVWEDRYISSSTSVASKTNIGYILSGWIYMNTNCWDNVMFDNVSLDNSIGGLFITTPLTMLLIPSIVNAFKTKRPWTIFGVVMCLILPFLPITAHAAFAFTNLYGRWQIWIVLIGIIFIIPTLDKIETVNRRWITLNLILNYAIAGIVYVLSVADNKLPSNYLVNVFGLQIPGLLFVPIAELIVMSFVWFVYRFKIFNPALVKKIMMIVAILEVGASCIVTVEQKSYHDWENYYIAQPEFDELNDVIKDLKKEDPSFYRIFNTEATRSITNMPSQLNYNGSNTFNSTYNFELDDFIDRSRMAYGGSWSMGNHEKRYWYDQYIGTKYYIIDKIDVNNDISSYSMDEKQLSYNSYYDGRTSKYEENQKYSINIPWGYKLYKEYKYYDVYINENFIGIGYTVDDFVDSTSVGKSKHSSYYEELYSKKAIVETDDVEFVKSELGLEEVNFSYSTMYKTFSFYNNWDLYFSPREDYSYFKEGDYERHVYKLNEPRFTKNEISSYLDAKSQFFHKRWEEKGRFGDQLILKTKNDRYVCTQASTENPAYVNFTFKFGPKVLISFYNNDTLVTQDAHMNSNSSLNNENYEWKLQRGFYINQPFNKVVIEFVSDTSFDKAFNSANYIYGLDLTYSYKNEMQARQDIVNANLLENVTYSNNKFKFTSNTNTKKLAVTNIPYDAGWTLKINGEKTDFIKVNGGFIGFITPAEEANYELSYFTPYLKEGIAITGIGTLLLVALCYVYRKKKASILLIEQEINSFNV